MIQSGHRDSHSGGEHPHVLGSLYDLVFRFYRAIDKAETVLEIRATLGEQRQEPEEKPTVPLPPPVVSMTMGFEKAAIHPFLN